MEVYGSSHHLAREPVQMGHEIRLIPLAIVKPFVKRQKRNAADAEAISLPGAHVDDQRDRWAPDEHG